MLHTYSLFKWLWLQMINYTLYITVYKKKPQITCSPLTIFIIWVLKTHLIVLNGWYCLCHCYRAWEILHTYTHTINTIIWTHTIKQTSAIVTLKLWFDWYPVVDFNQEFLFESHTCWSLSWWQPTKLKASSRKEYFKVDNMVVYRSKHRQYTLCHVTCCCLGLNTLPWSQKKDNNNTHKDKWNKGEHCLKNATHGNI